MYQGTVHLHSLLRWVVLVLLLVVIYLLFTNKKSNHLKKMSLFLLISSHIQLLLGLYQYFAGNFGYNLIKQAGFGAAMKDRVLRFWAIEHLSTMLIAIILITLAHRATKLYVLGAANNGKAKWMYLIAFLLIMAAIPWPFRELIGRPYFPGM
jgi:hypothetical protein